MAEVAIPQHARPFAHGHTGAIVAFDDNTHGPLVAKLAGADFVAHDRDVLLVEARALRSLAEHAPVPRVVSATEHDLHISTSPHASHTTLGAKPRRFKKTRL